MRVGVPLNWKLRLNLINLVLHTLCKQPKTKTKREKMVSVVTVLLCLLVPSRESRVTAALVGRKKVSVYSSLI